MLSKGRKGNFLLYLVGVIVVIVIVVVFLTKVGRQPAPLPQPVDQQVQQLQTQSTSDDLSALETDLQNTNLDQLDQELTDIERDLGSL